MIRCDSILDLATIGPDETPGQALEGSLRLAQLAERVGYARIWYAEHHNMRSIASSAPAVLIAHIAAHTSHIRLGSGGVMLPNHSPLTVAEQFGTLASLHPGRIELGLGRAPGTDQQTLRALRRDHRSADRFPQDVQELQGYLTGNTVIEGIHAIPGEGTRVPLYILGSSLFGAQLAAVLGLPYAFASHFAPDQLLPAIKVYREQFQPSEQLDQPHAFGTVNVLAADSAEEAIEQLQKVRRRRVTQLLYRDGRTLTDDEADLLLQTPQGAQINQMFRHVAVGDPGQVRDQLAEFAEYSGADELILAHQGPDVGTRLRSVELTAGSLGL